MRRIPLHLRIQLARSRVQAVRVSRVTGKRLRRLDVQLGRQGGHDLRIRDLLRLHRLHVAGALDRLRVRGTRLADLRQRTLALGLRIGQRPRIAVTPPAKATMHAPATNGTSQRGRRFTLSFLTLFSLIVILLVSRIIQSSHAPTSTPAGACIPAATTRASYETTVLLVWTPPVLTRRQTEDKRKQAATAKNERTGGLYYRSTLLSYRVSIVA